MRFLSLWALVLLISCADEKQPAATSPTSKNSDPFNVAVDSALHHYYQLSEAFVNWDSTRVPGLTINFLNSLKSLSDQMPDSGGIRSSLDSVNLFTDSIYLFISLEAKRLQLNKASQHLFSFLKKSRYDNSSVFLQRCPMAFADTGIAVWISPTDELRNPYLGLYHPYYGKSMLECGENLEVLNVDKKPSVTATGEKRSEENKK